MFGKRSWAGSAKVTIVVATYNRGSVLARALRTAIAQTETNWQALVIGDACSDDTRAQIDALGDDRIRFVNLPERFGEQAGPNSVGLALAETPFVAFLNQDDYWMPNHLAQGIRTLQKSRADLYWSAAAFFTNRGAWNDRVIFDEVSPPNRRLENMYDHLPFVPEPMSAWVAKTSALRGLGPMKLATQTMQVPISEYCQRASCAGLQLVTSEEITVLKDRVWHEPPSYDAKADYAEGWVKDIEAGEVDDLRDTIQQDVWLCAALGMQRAFAPETLQPGQAPKARLHRETGLNMTEMAEAARAEPPVLLNHVITARTGSTIGDQPDLDRMVEFARGALS